MSAALRAGGAGGQLPLGTVVGGRFRLQGALRADGNSEVYQALDSQGGAAARVRILRIEPGLAQALETDLTRAAAIRHPGLLAVLAFGSHEGAVYVASEAPDGHTLRQLIDAKRGQRETVGPAPAHALLSHVAAALDAARETLAHGALHPESIWLIRGGGVKLADLGLARAAPWLAQGGSPAGAPAGLYGAPEVLQGRPPASVSDVYSLGAILYELLTGMPPAPPLHAPSQIRRDVPTAADAVVAKGLAAHPMARFASPADLVRALEAAVGGAAGAESAAAAASAAPAEPAAAGGAPAPGAPRPTLGRAFNVSRAAGLTESDERWLIQKDRLDFGPFAIGHIMAQIEAGAFTSEDVIVDVDSGERQKIKEHPLLGEFALDAERKHHVSRRAQAEVVEETSERKRSRAFYLVVGAAVLVVGAGLALFLVNRKAARDDTLASRVSEADVDQFLKDVKIAVAPKKRGGGTRRAGAGAGADDFSGNMNLGDVSQGGGDDILSDSVVQNTMMANYRKLVPCVMAERRRSSGLTDIDLDFIVLGSGKVSAVRVNGQRSGPFASCLLGRMQAFGFPPYNGKKTIASWSMSMR